jgi:hypothetical protein
MTGNIVAYNRIYLNDVYIVGVSERENINDLYIAIKSSYQKVSIDGNSVRKIDPVLMSDVEIVVMSRDKNAAASKGSIYAHICANCGAPVENSLDLNCQYCGMPLNSTSNEWIITDILSVAEYREYVSGNKQSFRYNVDPGLVDKLMDVRDFAFNNIMVVIASDGMMSEDEYNFAIELAAKWGYNIDKIGPLFGMAMSGNLVVKMPEDDKKRAKIFRLMEKAAAIDGITEEEQNLMYNIREQYRISA